VSVLFFRRAKALRFHPKATERIFVVYEACPKAKGLFAALFSGLAGQDQGDVVGLLFGADPGIEGQHDLGGDDVEGLVAVAADDLHHALFAELAEVVFGFGDAVGVSDEDVAGLHLEAVFFVVHAVHEADDGTALVETADAAVAAQD
jgi:hypothetical protein